MNRRTLLKIISRALALVSTAVVVIPGIGYVLAPIVRRKKSPVIVQRVAKLKDLPVGKARLFALTGQQHDAWTHYAEKTIGRVWIIRRSDDATDPAACKVDVFTSVCPHIGCQTLLDKDKDKIFCPCHKAAWKLSGEKISSKDLGFKNPSPRGLDSLEYNIVQDEAQQWWVEVEYKNFKYGKTEKIARS